MHHTQVTRHNLVMSIPSSVLQTCTMVLSAVPPKLDLDLMRHRCAHPQSLLFGPLYLFTENLEKTHVDLSANHVARSCRISAISGGAFT